MEAVVEQTTDRGTSRWEKIRFTGEGGEYFRIWIVNVFLSIVTLGIYSAWAKVRTKRYFYGNTYLDGSAFEYHATGIMILKGRIIAVLFLLMVLLLGRLHPLAEVAGFVVIALLAPFVIWRSTIFSARMSSYRNVRFGFTKGVGPLYRYLLLIPLMPILIGIAVAVVMYANGSIDFNTVEVGVDGEEMQKGSGAIGIIIGLAILSVYLLAPYIQKAVTAYYLSGHLYGQGKFRARLSAGKYYLIYITVFGLAVLAYLLIIALGVGVYFLFGAQLSEMADAARAGGMQKQAVFIIPFLLIPLVMTGIWFKSYIVSRIRNYSLSKLRLESAITFRSRIKVNRLFWIQFSNVLLLVFTIGLAWPWTIVRVTRYKLETLYAHLHGDLDEYVTQMQGRQSALGEEIGEAFDLDLDLGI